MSELMRESMADMADEMGMNGGPLGGKGKKGAKGGVREKPRVVSNPAEVAAVVLAQMSMVSGKKDELTIAIKGLSDLAQQLARSYAMQMQMVQKLAARVKMLEGKAGCEAPACDVPACEPAACDEPACAPPAREKPSKAATC